MSEQSDDEEKLIKKKEQETKKFRRDIAGCQYHEEFMQKEFPNYLQKKYDLTGVYIAVHDIPYCVPDDEDDDPMAHFDMKRDACLTYIACS